MQLEFDKQLKQLTIKDDVPTHSKIIIFLMLLNVLNLGLQLFSMSFKENEIIFTVLLLITLLSIFVIVFYFLKRSWKSKYTIKEILGVEIKKAFGRERIFLILSNGKKRGFQVLKTEKEVKKLKKTLTSIGIKSL